MWMLRYFLDFYLPTSISVTLCLFCVSSELWEAQNAEAPASNPEENAEQSGASLVARIAFQAPTAPERPGISPNPPSYADLMSHDDALLSTSSSPTSAALLPRPQAVGSPGHPSPASLALAMGLGLGGASSGPAPTSSTPYLGNGDGSSSDSLDRQAAGQEDEEEEDDEDDDDEDEDSSEYENLVSEAPHLPALSASMLAQGRPAALSPDGDVRGSQIS